VKEIPENAEAPTYEYFFYRLCDIGVFRGNYTFTLKEIK